MKTLMATAAIVVIATCGYFVYENQQSKAEATAQAEAQEQIIKYAQCREQIKSAADLTDSPRGATLEEISFKLRAKVTKSQGESVANLLVAIFEDMWKNCGPL